MVPLAIQITLHSVASAVARDSRVVEKEWAADERRLKTRCLSAFIGVHRRPILFQFRVGVGICDH
jgi:hypothetical protein